MDKKEFNQRSETNTLPTDPSELTSAHLKALKPRKQRYDMLVGKGLALRVTPAGKITFRFIYRFDGKQRTMTVGTYPTATLKTLRGMYQKMAADVSMGIDPAADIRKAREMKQAEQANVEKEKVGLKVNGLIDLFLNHIHDDNNLSSRGRPWSQSCRESYSIYMLKDFGPEFGKLRVTDLNPIDISAWLKKIAIDKQPKANYILTVLRTMFDWACETDNGLMEINPAAGIKSKGVTVSKNRALDYNPELDVVVDSGEIRTFWYGMDEVNPLHRLAMQMILLTAQRPGEVCAAKWEHIVDDVWILPATITKNRKIHKIPLNPTLKRHLKLIQAISGNTRHLFPRCHYRDGKLSILPVDKPIARATIDGVVDRYLPEMARFTPHDLRRTASTHLKALSANDFEIGQLLNHSFGGVTAIYARGSDDKTVRKMLDKWHRRLDAILGEKVSNVVNMR